MNPTDLNFAFPTRVIFGPGKLRNLASMHLPGEKALLVITSDRIVEQLGILDKVITYLSKNDCSYHIYDGITSNPTKNEIMIGKELANEENCEFTIGIGGGSSIDSAKCISAMMRMEGDLWNYTPYGSGKGLPVTDAAPIIAISTTSGTGTETNGGAVITHDETREKVYVSSFYMRPTFSIIDPELMCSLPKHLTAFQGYDAIAHASECFIAKDCNQFAEMFALEILRIVSKWLPYAYEEPNNIEARSWIAYAADILGGMVQTLSPTTSAHTIGEAISGHFSSVQHGASLAVIAEAYYSKFANKIPDRLDQMGAVMGETPDGTGQGYLNALIQLLDSTGIRNISLSEHGINVNDLDKIAHYACNVVGFSADRYDVTIDDVKEILLKSYR